MPASTRSKSKSDLSALLAHFQVTNVNAFLSYGEQQDFADARKQIAAVDQGGLGLPEKDYYLRTGAADQKLRDQYVDYITQTFKLLGEPDAKAAEDAHKVMDLETSLAKAFAGHYLAARSEERLPHDDAWPTSRT